MEIIYIGPIGEPNKPFKGGFEAANRKNIDMLREKGYKVKEYPYPKIKSKFGPIAKLTYLNTFILPLKIVRYFKKKKNIILHITPFLSFLFLPTFLLVKTCNILGYKIILDIRAGNFVSLYKRRGIIWRKFVEDILKSCTGICVESNYYKNFFCKFFHLPSNKIHYFPNLSQKINLESPYKKNIPINLFYFGRVTYNKGIMLMIQLIELLGENYHLYIAGNADSTINIDIINNHSKISYLGPQTTLELKELMYKMHFFIFPSFHDGEGQSNSLIEAMSMGLIPIVSANGFSREVVGNCGAVIKEIHNANAYRMEIERIVNNNLIETEAKKSIRQIYNNHNLEKEIQYLIEFYQTFS